MIKILICNIAGIWWLVFFEKTGGDFNHPTKEMLEEVINQLADFSKNFRDPDVVSKHYNEIKELIDKLN